MAPIESNNIRDRFSCLINADGSMLLLLASDEQSFSVLETKSGRIVSSFMKKSKGFSSWGAFTTLSWSKVSYQREVQMKENGGKRRKKDNDVADQQDQMEVVCIGTQSGEIHLYSPSTAQILKSLTGGHGTDVAAISINSSGKRAYSASSDGLVAEWDLDSCKMTNSWKAESKGLSALCCMDDNAVATAGELVKVWDVVSKQQQKAFIGFASSISQIFYSNIDGSLFYSSSNDRFVNVALPSGKTGVLASQSNIKSVAESKKFVAALGSDGNISIWKRSNAVSSKTKKKQKSVMPDGQVCVVDETSGDALPILAFTFTGKYELSIVRGSVFKPVVERVSFVSQSESGSGEIESIGCRLMRKKSDSSLIQSVNGDQTSKNKNSFNESEIYKTVPSAQSADSLVVGALDAPIAKPAIDPDVAADTQPGTSVTIEAKLKALQLLEQSTAEIIAESANSSGNKKTSVPKPDSLLQMLTQALHSGDKQLLEECLKVSHQQTIDKTISGLSIVYVLKFLDLIVDRFQSNVNRGPTLIKWLRSLLTAHMAYLISLPDISSRLAPLYQSIDHRVALFPSLLKLNGRLTIITHQIRQRRENAKTMQEMHDKLQEPLMYFDETEVAEMDTMSEVEEEDELEEFDYENGSDQEEDEEDEV